MDENLIGLLLLKFLVDLRENIIGKVKVEAKRSTRIDFMNVFMLKYLYVSVKKSGRITNWLINETF